ncbi:MAG: AAA family ATPase, partial [Deltaproteobacteria bacterium]|nr:AAA family ATPase [Deltaproteobacteria bacterium]
FGSIDAIGKNIGENFLQTDGHAGKTISISLYEKIRKYTGDFLRTNEGLFLRRMAGGFIRDCHGDIHAGHVSITDRIDIIDCIEFNERFRFCDVVSDAAFLSMDIEFLGRGDLARAFEDAYFSETGDAEGRGLINFYKCYRAYVRGKVDGFKSLEAEVNGAERTSAYISARRHFHLSGLYASGGFRPMMLAVCGLSGTGKSSIARALAETFNMAVLSTDAVRKELAGVPLNEHRFTDIKGGIYSDEFTEKTYRTLITRAVSLVASGRPCILDGTFLKRTFLEEAWKRGKEAGLMQGLFHIVECVCGTDIALKRIAGRLEGRMQQPGAISDARRSVYLMQKKMMTSLERMPLPHMTIDTGKPRDENVLAVADEIFG